MEKIVRRRALRAGLALVTSFALATPAFAAPGAPSPPPAAAAPPSPAPPANAPAPAAAAPPPAPADPVRQARIHYERCLELYTSGSTEPALVECERAYELAPTHKILYNVGLINKSLRDYAGALRTFERYLAEGGDDVPGERRVEVEATMARLETMVATLEIRANVDHAELYVDDVPVGRSPLRRPVRINPGRRKVSASKPGFAPSTKVVAATLSDAVRVNLALTSLAAQAAAPSAPVAPASNPWATRAWVGWGVTAALAGGAAVTGVLALGASNELADLRDTPNAKASDLDGRYRTMKNLGLASDVLLGATVVGAGLSTWFTIRASGSHAAEGSAGRPRVEGVGVGPGGVALYGAF